VFLLLWDGGKDYKLGQNDYKYLPGGERLILLARLPLLIKFSLSFVARFLL